MKTLLFNLNDVALLLVIFECFLLSVLLVVLNRGRLLSRCLLSVFLLSIGLDALDTLIFWSAEVKRILAPISVYLFFCFKFSVFLAAPTLYLYVKSTLYADFRLSAKQIPHFLPVLLFPLFLAMLFSALGMELMRQSMFHFDPLFHHPLFQAYIWARNIAYVGYGCASLWLIARYQEQLKQGFSCLTEIDQSWLRILVGGFLAIWAGVFSSYIGHQLLESYRFADTTGVIGNYLNFIFINTLVVYSLAKPHGFQGVIANERPVQEATTFSPSSSHIEAIENAMQVDQLYLNSVLTLEQFAQHLALSPRYVSAIINGHFQKNFFEFTNEYRAAKAKSLLESPGVAMPMSEVMARSGFNSKATFNRFFKKFAGSTPSEYRRARTG